jgi:hypothetical protein
LWLLWQRLSHMRAWVRRMALIAVSGLIFVGANHFIRIGELIIHRRYAD